jgi:hypothetical protein
MITNMRNTACKQLAEALHAAVVALQATRTELATRPTDAEPAVNEPRHWTDKVGQHVALAVAACPDSVLRAWLLEDDVIGGTEIYRTMRAGAHARAARCAPAREVPS